MPEVFITAKQIVALLESVQLGAFREKIVSALRLTNCRDYPQSYH